MTTRIPYLPGQSGCNKRLRKLADTMSCLIVALAAQTSIGGDDVWLVCWRCHSRVARRRQLSPRATTGTQVITGVADSDIPYPTARITGRLRLERMAV